MMRLLARIVWVCLMAVVVPVTVAGGALVAASALMIPLVRWMAAKADGE